MNLIRQIQEDAADSTKDLGDLLRRCQILASRIGHVEFAAWVEKELNGFYGQTPLPDYRVVAGDAYGHFIGPFNSQMLEVPLPAGALREDHRVWAERIELREPIGTFSDMVREGTPKYRVDWPPELIAVYARSFYEGRNILHRAWQPLNRSQIVSVLNIVRNRILKFALDLEKADPEIGEPSHSISDEVQEKISHVYNINFLGNVGNVAAGSSGFSQVSIAKGDLAGFKAELCRLGVSPSEIVELEESMEADGTGKFGPRTKGWLGGMMGKVASGVGQIAISAAGTVLPKLLLTYFGIPN